MGLKIQSMPDLQHKESDVCALESGEIRFVAHVLRLLLVLG